MTSAAPNLSQLADRKNPDRWYATGFAMVALIVAVRLLLHLLTANRYGIFRDELYYIACRRHLDWGYVDMPPFIPALTWLFTGLFGSSLFVIRLIPAIAGCGAIALTGYQAYQFGGRRFAMALAALAMAVSPVFVINGHLLV
jgi:predicted membrane-bound mannosyltransferase